jgi:hypothetical protein
MNLDRGLLVQSVVDPQDPETGAIVDGGELVVALPGSLQRGDELDVDLDPVPGQRLLVALPTLGVALVALGGGQPAHAEAPQDVPGPRGADGDVVVPPQVHRDLVRSEVVALPQVDDLADHLGPGGSRAVVRSP